MIKAKSAIKAERKTGKPAIKAGRIVQRLRPEEEEINQRLRLESQEGFSVALIFFSRNPSLTALTP